MKKSMRFDFTPVVADKSHFQPAGTYRGTISQVPMAPAIGTGRDWRYTPMRAVPAQGEPNGWGGVPTENIYAENMATSPIVASTSTKPDYQGEYFREVHDGVVQITNSGAEKKLMSAKLRIVRRIVKHGKETEPVEVVYDVRIECEEWEAPKFIQVKHSEYKNLLTIIRVNFPGISVFSGNSDSAEEYLTHVFNESKDTWDEWEIAKYRGWILLNGKVVYAHGVAPYYKSAPIPAIKHLPLQGKYNLFYDGLTFLDVGYRSSEMVALFLYAHLGFSHYWLEKAGIAPRFCCYISGPTGSLKTSVAKELANVFESNSEKRVLRFSGTKASLKEYVAIMNDCTICIDDFSNTEARSKKDQQENMEELIRIVGDGVISSKMEGGEVQQSKARTNIIMTGEIDGVQGFSSSLRCVHIHVDKGSFDGKKLVEYQGTDRLSRYFALFIECLEIYGDNWAKYVSQNLEAFRARFSALGEFRMVDAAVVLSFQSVFLCEVAMLCFGMPYNEAGLLCEYFDRCIVEVLSVNAQESQVLSPAMRFVYALRHVLRTGYGNWVAADEGEYVADEAKYIGFREGECLWLKYDEAHSLVRRYWENRQEAFLSTPKQVKEDLAKRKFIKTVLITRRNQKDGTIKEVKEFLVKAKKGSRKRMLVLLEEKAMRAADECEN